VVALVGPWAGVDVGATRKGFHVAVIDEGSLLEVTSGLAWTERSASSVSTAPAWSRSTAQDGRHPTESAPVAGSAR
jgi:hypothetical protein